MTRLADAIRSSDASDGVAMREGSDSSAPTRAGRGAGGGGACLAEEEEEAIRVDEVGY